MPRAPRDPEHPDAALGRLLSYVLRHKPDHLGLTLDDQAYVSVDALLTALGPQHHECDLERLRRVVRADDKARFAFDPSGTRIRAQQGHSASALGHRDLGLSALEPPERLYHGTPERFVSAILKQGLRPMQRHHVHLSAEPDAAAQVGLRRGQPQILEIAAAAMFRAGHEFYRSENGVWLTAAVPPEFVGVLGTKPKG